MFSVSGQLRIILETGYVHRDRYGKTSVGDYENLSVKTGSCKVMDSVITV